MRRDAKASAYGLIRKPVQPDRVRQVAVLEGDHADEVAGLRPGLNGPPGNVQIND